MRCAWGRNRLLIVTAGMVAFLVALVAVLSVGCGSNATSGDASGATTRAEAGFSGVTLDGAEVSLSEYRGKPLVLAFMASW